MVGVRRQFVEHVCECEKGKIFSDELLLKFSKYCNYHIQILLFQLRVILVNRCHHAHENLGVRHFILLRSKMALYVVFEEHLHPCLYFFLNVAIVGFC